MKARILHAVAELGIDLDSFARGDELLVTEHNPPLREYKGRDVAHRLEDIHTALKAPRGDPIHRLFPSQRTKTICAPRATGLMEIVDEVRQYCKTHKIDVPVSVHYLVTGQWSKPHRPDLGEQLEAVVVPPPPAPIVAPVETPPPPAPGKEAQQLSAMQQELARAQEQIAALTQRIEVLAELVENGKRARGQMAQQITDTAERLDNLIAGFQSFGNLSGASHRRHDRRSRDSGGAHSRRHLMADEARAWVSGMTNRDAFAAKLSAHSGRRITAEDLDVFLRRALLANPERMAEDDILRAINAYLAHQDAEQPEAETPHPGDNFRY